MVACGESRERFHNIFVRTALFQRCPVTAGYLPVDTATLFDKYVPLIEMETSLDLTNLFNLLPGILDVVFDGVVVNK